MDGQPDGASAGRARQRRRWVGQAERIAAAACLSATLFMFSLLTRAGTASGLCPHQGTQVPAELSPKRSQHSSQVALPGAHWAQPDAPSKSPVMFGSSASTVQGWAAAVPAGSEGEWTGGRVLASRGCVGGSGSVSRPLRFQRRPAASGRVCITPPWLQSPDMTHAAHMRR